MRVYVPKVFECSYSFRPDAERKCALFAFGHASDGQPAQIFGEIFTKFIIGRYGENAVSRVQKLGFIAVLSILDEAGIYRSSMASDDCRLSKDSTAYKKICDELMRSFHDCQSLHLLLEKEYDIVPLQNVLCFFAVNHWYSIHLR